MTRKERAADLLNDTSPCPPELPHKLSGEMSLLLSLKTAEFQCIWFLAKIKTSDEGHYFSALESGGNFCIYRNLGALFINKIKYSN